MFWFAQHCLVCIYQAMDWETKMCFWTTSSIFRYHSIYSKHFACQAAVLQCIICISRARLKLDHTTATDNRNVYYSCLIKHKCKQDIYHSDIHHKSSCVYHDGVLLVQSLHWNDFTFGKNMKQPSKGNVTCILNTHRFKRTPICDFLSNCLEPITVPFNIQEHSLTFEVHV